MAEKPIVQFFQAGASSLIKHFCQEIDLVNRINRTVVWDPAQWKVSPGHHVLALTINTLCGRLPLCRVKEFYRKQDVEVLFGQGVTADDFNDDALGRTLDRLHDADPKSILSSITLESLMTADEPLLFAHGDTTSKTLYGDYDYPETDGVVHIARGYNKDGQFDAKQIVIGMVTVNQGTPLFANVCSGNQDDPTWNADMVETIGNELHPEQIVKLVYVADSKFL
jgi:transposase